jgi:Niemann-Pick C1 protein
LFRFIDLMKAWEQFKKPEFMEIAYSAERSVEDEIARTSSSEMGTVAISYVVMFIYIAVALGRYTLSDRFLVKQYFHLGPNKKHNFFNRWRLKYSLELVES